MTVVYLVALMATVLLPLLVEGQWKMVDRFYGFRYEIPDSVSRLPDAATALQSQADLDGCFGWVQKSRKGSWVGEVRCSKERGLEYKKWLENYAGGESAVDILVYEDTKIRLHFSHFKILEEARDSCFLEPPHKCEDLGGSGSDGDEARGVGGSRGDEL